MWLKKRHLASEHAHPGPSLPTRMGDQRRKDRNVPTKPVRRRALSLSGHHNPNTMAEHNHRTSQNHGMNTWRAECSGSCTSGSEGGPGKPTSRKAGKGAPVRPLHVHSHAGWVGVRGVHHRCLLQVHSGMADRHHPPRQPGGGRVGNGFGHPPASKPREIDTSFG